MQFQSVIIALTAITAVQAANASNASNATNGSSISDDSGAAFVSTGLLGAAAAAGVALLL
ncbi:hypothetical protein PSN45_001431 [Yamadazyma tenuis]|uniref:Uncharacterized protein n=1 Tax=Candida tenuis (strain ATCC 10573 / BCRC 21748 / CBS 615 / JCM 9827 / NBRC 10315 / NRRL Y-1498 / VKM Y-70) TaxID=590646 RepID=G3BC36_CANTC|nr:uncharacterized protein CANTEDRAFT_116836 [Yamadazyma tenuis ATCC 10573]EGV60773.1 hypothetical protein CANTEDRAFT_116836 [Yamadazyma tenuis ATCC 10573]WEJ93954.1 hypothetical protein PSN45_001431 [Yamadazyma tenuis]